MTDPQKLSVLVTGGNGLIAEAFLNAHAARFAKVYTTSRKTLGAEDNSVKYILGGSSDQNLPAVDVVVHLAGETSAVRARGNVARTFRENVLGLIDLLDFFKESERATKVILAGTVTQLGYTNRKTGSDKIKSDDPLSFYDVYKSTCESVLRQYVREGWLQGCCLRFANVYNVTRSQRSPGRGVIETAFRKALENEDIVCGPSGKYLRDFVYVKDIADAIFLAAINDSVGSGRAFEVGTGSGMTIVEALKTVVEVASQLSGSSSSIINQPKAYGERVPLLERRNFVANSVAFRELTGWAPKFSLKSGLIDGYHEMRKKLQR